MIKKQAKNSYLCVMLALLLLAVMLVSGRYISPAFADTPQYTSALTDLQKDSEFNVDDYPDNAKDYSIQVIQIAESTNKELFVYTYQPSQKTTYFVATEINMSLSETVDGTRLYALTLLNCDGVFCKYKVNDFTVSDEVIRYYNITSIYREWQKGIDEETGNDNTKNAVAFSVGKLYKATTDENGDIAYIWEKTQVVEVLNPYVGLLRYSDGYHFGFLDGHWSYTDVHFIAFDTDWAIDSLLEADVEFSTQQYSGRLAYGGAYKLIGTKVQHDPITLHGKEKGGNAADGFLSKRYEWERIQKTADFVKTYGLLDSTIQAVKDTQWVLMFYETETKRESGNVQGNWHDEGTMVTDVTILRLKFYSSGKLYNLGAVSDKVTGANKPGNYNTDEHASFWEWLSRVTGIPEWVWKFIFVVLILAICLPILSLVFPVFGQVLAAVFKVIGKAFVWLFKGLWWLICLPFKGIAALVRKIKDKKDGGT